MKVWHIFKKSILEQVRDIWPLILTLIFSPFFVLLYWMMFAGGFRAINLGILNLDKPVQNISRSSEWIKNLNAAQKKGIPVFKIIETKNNEEINELLRLKKIDVGFIIPKEFTEFIETHAAHKSNSGIRPTMTGDMTNPMYIVGVTMTILEFEKYVYDTTHEIKLIDYNEVFTGTSGNSSDFDMSIPGLIVFSVILLIFTSSIAFVREIEEKTILRLQLSSVKSWEIFTGIGLSQFVIGFISILFTLGTAVMLGYHSDNIFPIFIPLLLTILSIQAISLIVASFCRGTKDVLIIGNFPLFLLMWFSGAMYPFPRNEIFKIADHSIYLNDFLPPTHAVNAMNKVMIFGSNTSDILYEIVFLSILCILYALIGVYLFRTRKNF